MATILSIETSTTVCSTALSAEGMILCHYEDFSGRNHATLLSGYIKGCLDHLRRHEMRLDAVAVSIGPGSYTGLRIGLSEAKGLAYGLKVPLIGVDTLKIMAASAIFNHDITPDGDACRPLLVPMIDARRMEVYTAVYDCSLTAVLPPTPLVLDDAAFAELFEMGDELYIMGDGSTKARSVITSPQAHFIEGIAPLATDMMPLAEMKYAAADFLDLAYSVPTYLKEFQATKPKKPF